MHRLITTIVVSLLAITPVLAQSAPRELEDRLIKALDNISAYGTYLGAYDEVKLAASNKLVRDGLLTAGKQETVLKYAFPKLKDKLSIATSKDGRLRIYSWDVGDGGTMHHFDNVYQYQGKSGSVYTWAAEAKPEDSGGEFFTEFFELDVADGPIYLGVGTFIGSTSLAGQSINAFRINGESLDREAKVIRTGSGVRNSISFTFDFFSVVDHPERPLKLFHFDPVAKTFRFPVVIEDDERHQGRVTNKFITYKFDGKYFVKVS